MLGDGDGEMSGESLNAYERERAENLARNAGFLHALGFQQLIPEALKEKAKPSGGPKTRSKRKRASESESDSERVKRMKEEGALDEETLFNKLGIKDFSYKDLKQRQSECLDVFQAAYAERCRTKKTERLTPGVLRKSQKIVDILGFERIRKVHESSSEEDLVRLERHMEKTGEDALGLWGACQREGCTRPCTQWEEDQGRFYQRHRESGWCQTCHNGGEPSSDPIAEAQARAASAEALIEEFFDSYANAGYDEEAMRRWKSHVERTGENPFDVAWSQCQREGCTRPCTKWDEDQGRFYQRHRESGWCHTCHNGGEPGSDAIAEAQARAASAEALIEEFFDSYANAGYDEEAMRRWKSHVERTGENPFDVAWSQCQREGCTRKCGTRWQEDRGRFNRLYKGGWCYTCHNGGEPSSDAIAEAQARAASAEALIEEFFDSYANAGYDEEAMRRWKSHVERTGENPFDVAWSQCQREGCTRPCTKWDEDQGRFYQRHRESGWCYTCHNGGEPSSDAIAEAQARAASAEALIEEFFDSYANAGYDEEAMRRWKSHVERTGENPFDVAWSQCQREGCTRPCTQWDEDRGRFYQRHSKSGWCETCHNGGEPGSDPIAEAQARAASAEALIEEFFDSYANAGYDEEAMRRWKSHVERTGENPFDVAWSQCQREGCTRKCGTRWQEDRGRFNRLYKGGWCYTCHKGGEPSYE